jgi:putative transcriptional regulator
MSDDTTNAKMRSDGTLVRIMSDGSEQPVPIPPSRPLSDAEALAAALADPDAQPFTAEQLAAAQPVPRVKTLRRALRMTQEEFAARFHLSLATVRDWEQGRAQPDQTASTYLAIIARNPQLIMQLLDALPESVAQQ